MRRQLSTYIDPEQRTADRKLAQILDREAARTRSVSRVIYDALLDHFGIVRGAGKLPTLPAMENVYPGRVVAQRSGLATVQIGNRRVFAGSRLPARTKVFVSIRGHSIALQLSPDASGSSIRNALAGRVRRVLELDEVAYVDLRAGTLVLRAMVTPAAVRELGIAPGRDLTMVFKALSVKLTPR